MKNTFVVGNKKADFFFEEGERVWGKQSKGGDRRNENAQNTLYTCTNPTLPPIKYIMYYKQSLINISAPTLWISCGMKMLELYLKYIVFRVVNKHFMMNSPVKCLPPVKATCAASDRNFQFIVPVSKVWLLVLMEMLSIFRPTDPHSNFQEI